MNHLDTRVGSTLAAISLLSLYGCSSRDRATLGNVGNQISEGVEVVSSTKSPTENGESTSNLKWNKVVDISIPLASSSITPLGSYSRFSSKGDTRNKEDLLQASYYLIKSPSHTDPVCPNGYLVVVLDRDKDMRGLLDQAAIYSMSPDHDSIEFIPGETKTAVYHKENILDLRVHAKIAVSPEFVDLSYEGLGDTRNIAGFNKFNLNAAGKAYVAAAAQGSPYDMALSKFFSQDGKSTAVLLRAMKANISEARTEIK